MIKELKLKMLLKTEGYCMKTWTYWWRTEYSLDGLKSYSPSESFLYKLPFFRKVAEIRVFDNVQLIINTSKNIRELVKLAKKITMLDYEVEIWNSSLKSRNNNYYGRCTIIPPMLNPERSIPASNRRFKKAHPELYCEHGWLREDCIRVRPELHRYEFEVQADVI